MIKKLNDFISRGDDRSIRAKKNISVSFLIKGGSVLVNLILVPISISYISVKDYGVWLTLGSVIAWFSFFDIGFGHGLRNKFAEAIANNNLTLARVYVSTTYAILSILICAIWATFFILNHFLNWSLILNVDKSLEIELSQVALVIFSFFCLQFILKLVGTVLTAIQQSGKASYLDFFAQLLSLALIFGFSKLNPTGSLLKLAVFSGGAQVFVLFFASIWFFQTDLRKYSPSLKFVEFPHARSLMQLGIKFFMIQVSAVFIFQTTNIVITQLLGPDQVTIYNVAFRYFSLATMICGIVATPFWSAFTEAYTKGDFLWMKKVTSQLNYFWIILILLVSMMLFVSNYVYNLWVGNHVQIPFIITILMALNIIVTTRFNLFIILLNGTGKIKLQLIINLILSFVFIPLSITLGKVFGLAGIVGANLIINSIYCIVVPIQSFKILNQTAKGIWNK